MEASARCYDQNLNKVLFENILTSSGNCLMIMDFYSGGTKYKLAMGPSLSQTLQQHPTTAPATGLVTVTCNSTSYGKGRIEQTDRAVQQSAREDEACQRLTEIAGIGPVTATALIAALGNASQGSCLCRLRLVTPHSHRG